MRLHRLRTLVLAASLAASAPLAATLPDLALPGARNAPLPSAAVAVDALVSACGSRLGAVTDALAMHVQRGELAPRVTAHSTDTGGIAVLEDDGTFFYSTPDGHPVLDIAAVSNAFYRTHGDDYDFLAVYLASGLDQWLGSPGALAAAWVLRNDTQGLGIPTFDLGPSFGSAARLQVLLTMNALSRYPSDPDAPIGGPTDSFSTMDVIAHEFAHRWLAYPLVDSAGTPSPALLGRDQQHWNFFFDADSSFMEGCDWTAIRPDSFLTTGVSATFGALDQYLMGLRTKAEMSPFFVVNDPTAFDPPGTYFPGAVPWPGIGCRGRATWWTVDDIERVHGPRVPDGAVAPRHWRVGFVLIVPPGADPSPGDLAKLQVIRGRFPQTIADATWQRGSVDVSLDSRAGSVRIAHAPLHDVETAAPLVVGARISIDQAGIPLAVAPASVAFHWRQGASGAFGVVPMSAAAPDSFTGVLPAGPAGPYEYWLSASSDSAGIGATLPAAGAAAPFHFTVGPDVAPPLVRHSPVRAQAYDRMPQALLARVSDNLGVDAVWFESSADGGPVQTVPLASAGGDSFVVAAGAGLQPGHVLAYRFVARDGAAAGNVGYSNAAFDTLRVGRDFFDDFENPASWAHANVSWLWRDAWALDPTQSSPAGGTSWHCGSADGAAYPPHIDAMLYSGDYYSPVPGMTLTFDERHDLEEASATQAFDAARVEIEDSHGPWTPVEPSPGYTHTMPYNGMPFAKGTACWSGTSPGWVTRTVDLGAYSGLSLRVRIRMISDDLVGKGGLWVDRIRVHYPGPAALGVGASPLALSAGPAWPNPSRGPLRLALALPGEARIQWTLHDLQGRRVATLWDGGVPAGRNELVGAAPDALPAGLYFARVDVGGRTVSSSRIVLIR